MHGQVNTSYCVARVHALPEMCELDAHSGVPIEEQLGLLLTLHHQTVIHLFQDWDTDGNGGIDKKEFRKAVAALHYKAPKAAVDQLFDHLDPGKTGFIEYSDLQHALHQFVHAAHAPKHRAG